MSSTARIKELNTRIKNLERVLVIADLRLQKLLDQIHVVEQQLGSAVVITNSKLKEH